MICYLPSTRPIHQSQVTMMSLLFATCRKKKRIKINDIKIKATGNLRFDHENREHKCARILVISLYSIGSFISFVQIQCGIPSGGACDAL